MTDENKDNDDQAVGPSNEPPGLNAAQIAERDKTAGTGQSTSSNLDGSGTKNSNTNTASTDAPGRRLKNPLGALSSYTYQLSLYMITPDAYDAFQATGRTKIDALANATEVKGTGGAYLIAQSGGINTTEPDPVTGDVFQRAPGFDLDYYIDNLVLKQAISGKETQSSTNIYTVTFDITEPYGFSFNTKLRRASDQLQEYFNDTGYSGNGTIKNPSRQFFIMGIKFLGYDENGSIVKGDTEFEGGVLDPNASGNGIFETFYDLSITSNKFSIEGGATKYRFEGVALSPGMAFGIKRGRLDSAKTISGKTFNDAIDGPNGLLTKLNAIEKKKVDDDNAEFANIFKIEYVGDGVDAIKDARLILPTDTDKAKWVGPNGTVPKSWTEATDAKSATAVPNDAHRQMVFARDTTFIEIFDEILKKSGYAYDALITIYKSDAKPDLVTGKQESSVTNSKTKVAWYKVTPQISEARWDGTVVDWAYTTTFTIEKYETPIITSYATNPATDYYGPHKRYEYWWTGENREILEYSQVLDNLFYNEVLGNISGNEPEGQKANQGNAEVPGATNKAGPMPLLNNLGGGGTSINNYVTSLYSPDSYATAKIKIMGDPDFLVQDHRDSEDSVYQRFYANDGYRVTANGGQVFMEIDFKEAIDYDNKTGVMDLNESILFWKYPDKVADSIKGVSYQLTHITSTFADGRFIQDLTATLNTFGNAEDDATPLVVKPGIPDTTVGTDDAGAG